MTNIRIQSGTIMIANSKLQFNIKTVLFVLFGAALVFYIVYSAFGNTVNDHKGNDSYKKKIKFSKSWKTHSFVGIPDHIHKAQNSIKVEEIQRTFEFAGQELSVTSLEARPSKENAKEGGITVLLLHGARFTVEDWQQLETITFVAAAGYSCVAVDLPGWGKSSQIQVNKAKKGEFLATLIKELHLDRPIIVSPSMSGSYSIPFLMSDPATCHERSRGFIPIAPVGTDEYSHAKYHRCEIPTFILYGSKDKSLGLNSVGNLRNLLDNEIHVFEGSGHACYVEHPDEWHNMLYNFLLAIDRLR